MILRLLTGAMLLFLTGCVTTSARVENHGSDLEVLKLGVQVLTKPREVAGEIKYLDEAKTNDEAYTFAGNAEEAFWLSERDKAGLREFVEGAVERIRLSRVPACRWYQLSCKE